MKQLERSESTKCLIGFGLGFGAGAIGAAALWSLHDEDQPVDTPILIGNGSLHAIADEPFPSFASYMQHKLLKHPQHARRLDIIDIEMTSGMANPPLPQAPLMLTGNRAYTVEVYYGEDEKIVCETDFQRRNIAIWVHPGTFLTHYDLDQSSALRYDHKDAHREVTRVVVSRLSPGSRGPVTLVDSVLTRAGAFQVALQSKAKRRLQLF